jgi:hypothetical protein
MSLLRKPILACVASLLLLAGCSRGVKLADINGTLNYKGKPVPNAFVDFTPEGGKGRPSWGQTDEQGHFTLSFDPQREGALVGKHKVSLRMKPSTAAEQEAIMKGQAPPMSKERAELFDKYSIQKSNKMIEIKDGDKELNIDLD